MDSTEMDLEGITPLELAAARGELPDWSRAGPERREHMARVAGLLEGWAHELGLGEAEALRWAAAGWLHDVLRDADPGDLVRFVREDERDLPGSILHGPAAAGRLQGEVDPRLVLAVRYHTLGHPALDRLGRAVYLADFLEPGRKVDQEWRGGLRDRMPHQMDHVLVEVIASRINHVVEKRKPLRGETAAFWSAVVGKGPS